MNSNPPDHYLHCRPSAVHRKHARLILARARRIHIIERKRVRPRPGAVRERLVHNLGILVHGTARIVLAAPDLRTRRDLPAVQEQRGPQEGGAQSWPRVVLQLVGALGPEGPAVAAEHVGRRGLLVVEDGAVGLGAHQRAVAVAAGLHLARHVGGAMGRVSGVDGLGEFCKRKKDLVRGGVRTAGQMLSSGHTHQLGAFKPRPHFVNVIIVQRRQAACPMGFLR